MNGAESLLGTLVNNGIEVCFANPGTSEMHFVAALDEVEGVRCILGLFEGVLSGAADGYARMARKPAATLLHLGPGLGNALANIHNAKKAYMPMLNVIGDHATYHLEYDAPLTSDIAGIAGPVSHWVHSAVSADDLAADTAEACAQAKAGQIATLILPANVSWGDSAAGAASAGDIPTPEKVPEDRIEQAIEKLRDDRSTLIMIGGRDVDPQRGLMLSRIGKSSGARVSTDTFPTRVARGAGTADLERLPYLAELAIDHIKEVETLVLIGAVAPVSFFAYPDVPSAIAAPGCEQFVLATPEEDIDHLLEALLERLDAVDVAPDVHPLDIPALPTGELNATSVATSLAALLPEGAIVVDEGITSALACYPLMATAQPHDWLNQTGGAIGWGLPAAVGAAVACPDRRVLCLEGDGSAMYTIQSLWTMARENLDITIVVFNNRKYSILELEFSRTGARGGTPGPKAASTLDIGTPDMDFVAMAHGMGVAATRATTAEEFNEQLREAFASRGPRLIDAIVPTVM